MAVNSDGWLTEAERVAGPVVKTNGGRNTMIGFVAHSAEGWERTMRDYVADVNVRKSWHFSNLRDGRLLQHYPVTAQCWTSGSGFPNNNFVSMESEGLSTQPLNEAQLANVVLVIKALSVFTNRPTVERTTEVKAHTLMVVEHNECTKWGSLATSCPSGRYNWELIMNEVNAPPAPWYTREQGLSALAHLSERYARQLFTGLPLEGSLHPFDVAVLKDIVNQLESK